MIFGPMFDQFVNQSPISVMARATIEHALSASALDALFEDTAERGYTRELLFSTTVDLMSLVVAGKAPHVQAAYKHLRERVPVTLKCVYEKLQNLETGVSAALVRHVAGRGQGLITALGGTCQPLLPGYRVRIIDGNHLAATQRRSIAGTKFGGARSGVDADYRPDPLRRCPHPGTHADRTGVGPGRSTRRLDRGPQLLHGRLLDRRRPAWGLLRRPASWQRDAGTAREVRGRGRDGNRLGE